MVSKHWKKPKLQLEKFGNVEKHATWMELFYDLAFVVAIAALAHDYSHHLEDGPRDFLLLFFAVYLLWITQTYYADQFDTDDLSHQLAALLQMVGILGLAIWAQDAFDSRYQEFILSFMLVRGVITFNFFRAGYHNPDARGYAYGLGKGFLISLFVWGIALFAPSDFRVEIFIIALLVDFITPNLSYRSWTLDAEGSKGLFLVNINHLTERIGLFLIIILGESMVGIVNGVQSGDQSQDSQILAVVSIFLMFSVWWIYFDVNERGRQYQNSYIKREVSEKEKRWGYFQGIFTVQGTVIIAAILIFIAVALEHVIATENEVFLTNTELWLLAGSLAGFVYFVGISELPTHTRLNRGLFWFITFMRFGIGTLMLSVAALGLEYKPLIILLILLILMIIQILLTIGIQQREPEEKRIE